MKDTVKDLADRLALLHVRHLVAFNSTEGPSNPLYVDIAEKLEAGLRAGDEIAVSRVRGVVDPADLASPQFWATPLGRRLFAAGGGGPGAVVSQSFAAGLLGCSRQYVHELIGRGRLTQVDGMPVMVLVEDVRALLILKLDKEVK